MRDAVLSPRTMKKCCLPFIWQERNFVSHQSISYQITLSRIPRVSTVSRERVALFQLWATPRFFLRVAPESFSLQRTYPHLHALEFSL